MKKISVVIPAYNSSASLRILIEKLEKELIAATTNYEVILVNDGSQDETWKTIEILCEENRLIRGINLMRNYGQHNALLCGIRAATGEIIITMDDDLQHPPQEIHKLLSKLAEGYDVVYGTPQEEQHGIWRDFASRVTKLGLQSAMGAKNASRVSAFRAFRAELRAAFQDYRSPFVSIDALLAWGTTAFSFTPVAHHPRKIGKSNYNFQKLATHAINMLTGFSTLPLQLASWMGFAFTCFGVLVFIFVLIRYMTLGYSVPGFPFLASIIAILSGAQLFSIGVIGEYLARMHIRLMEKPSYTIRHSLNTPQIRDQEFGEIVPKH